MLGKNWVFPPEYNPEAKVMGRDLGCSPIVAQILWRRGYQQVDAARHFLTPLEQRLDHAIPELMDLPLAVERLHRARAANERVRIFGDYDVDGVSATALMMRALRRFGIERLDCYIPEREVDGYGINSDHIRSAANAGIDLMVTVDNGITAHDAARTATDSGMDMIITDHHHFDCDVPAVVACVNPKRDGQDHPLHDISGSAVAWLLAQALTGDAHDELAYVALGTIADVMPLTGINRLLVAQGLKLLSLGTVMGITALAGKAKLDLRQLRAEHIAYQIGPRLNAAGRLGNARAALDLLLAEESREAARLSSELEQANLARRRIERTVFEDAVARLDEEWNPARKTIVLGSEEWPRGIVGIVASKIAEKYERPAALLNFGSDGRAHGSARSRLGFDLMEALAASNGRLQKYGGHRGAAGFTLALSDVEDFALDFEGAASSMDWQAVPEDVEVDGLLSFSEIDSRLLRDIALMEPFGMGNHEPLFCTCGVQIPIASVREFKGGHLGLQIAHDGRQLPAIAFGMGHLASSLRNQPAPYDVLYRPKFNTFRDQTTIQLQIQALRRTA